MAIPARNKDHCQSGSSYPLKWKSIFDDTVKKQDGQTRLPSGLIFKWGRYKGTTGKRQKNFWSPFPSITVSILASCSTGYETVNSFDKNGFNSNSNISGGDCIYYATGW